MENIINRTESMETVDNTVFAATPDVTESKIESPAKKTSPTTSVSTIPTIHLTPTERERETSTVKACSPETVAESAPASSQPAAQLQSQTAKPPRRISEIAPSICPICESEATKKKGDVDVLKCSSCGCLVHFACTNLPPYQLYKYKTTASKFSCEICVNTPEQFLTDMVTKLCQVCECKVINELPIAPPPTVLPAVDNRYDILENKVNELSVVLEKFDLQSLSDKLSQLGSKLETTNNNMTANVKYIEKMKTDTVQRKPDELCVYEDHLKEAEKSRNDLASLQKELDASNNSNELLMSTITERDRTVNSLRERLENTLVKHREKDQRISALDKENMQIKHDNTVLHNEKVDVTEQWSLKTETLLSEREQFSQSLDETTNQLNKANSSNATYVEVNALLKKQIEEVTDLNKSLKESLDRFSVQRTVGTSRQRTNEETANTDNDEGEDDGQADVVILHDSLCKGINNTIMGREKVSVRKVWAPDLAHMDTALDDINAKVIVLQAGTRDINKIEVEEMNEKIVDLVDKALTKADKVVISTIVNRDDIVDINLKVNSVNCFMLLTYTRNENVIVCDNSTWYHRDFHTADKLHLTEEGTSALASNLKYAMAEAADVRVVKKRPNTSNYSSQRRRYRGNRHSDYYRNSYW
jgi:hypothetical protein